MAGRDIFGGINAFRDYTVDGEGYKVPIRYYKQDTFFAVYGADLKAIRKALPGNRFTPIRHWPGRALVFLAAFNYIETDIGPYGEFCFGIPCLCLHQARRLFGAYIHKLPVTTKVACVAGKHNWGYPKFVCNMQFENNSDFHQVKLDQDGETILELRVEKGGLGLDRAITLGTFTVKNGEIIHTRITGSGMSRVMPDGFAKLDTGLHEMGLELEGFGLGKRPLVTGDFLDLNLLLPEGESLGPV